MRLLSRVTLMKFGSAPDLPVDKVRAHVESFSEGSCTEDEWWAGYLLWQQIVSASESFVLKNRIVWLHSSVARALVL